MTVWGYFQRTCKLHMTQCMPGHAKLGRFLRSCAPYYNASKKCSTVTPEVIAYDIDGLVTSGQNATAKIENSSVGAEADARPLLTDAC